MNAKVRAEIAALMKAAPRGLLKPTTVVGFAQSNPQSALHREFQWDNAEAGRLYRIQQARGLIRVVVEHTESDPEPVRVYVTLTSDSEHGGGYRQRQRVVNNRSQRMVLAADALNYCLKIKRMNGYSTLDELEPFFSQLDRLVAKHQTALGLETVEEEA